MTDEELKDFMKYFKDELPDPEHHPQKGISCLLGFILEKVI